MILFVGEILADLIGCERDDGYFYERKAGGAPFNAACAAKKMGAKVGFAGSVGKDEIGRFLIDVAKKRGFDELIVDEPNDRNTTLAFVDIDGEGERSFGFFRRETADYVLPTVPKAVLDGADVVHLGSLALGVEEGVRYMSNLAANAKNAGKIVSFDVNFRSDIFTSVASAVAVYRDFIALADVVKLSSDEVELFGREYVESLSDKLVLVTHGKLGCERFYRGESKIIPSVAVKPVDTTGAGDAFFGAFLAGLDSKLSASNAARADGAIPLEPNELDDILVVANACGALNTLSRGAVDGLPDRAAVDKFLKEGRR